MHDMDLQNKTYFQHSGTFGLNSIYRPGQKDFEMCLEKHSQPYVTTKVSVVHIERYWKVNILMPSTRKYMKGAGTGYLGVEMGQIIYWACVPEEDFIVLWDCVRERLMEGSFSPRAL